MFLAEVVVVGIITIVVIRVITVVVIVSVVVVVANIYALVRSAVLNIKEIIKSILGGGGGEAWVTPGPCASQGVIRPLQLPL